ncbi:BTB/POZ domain-containing protein 6-B-like isoform X2 [Macrosteles quadrilineatus]|nr:BTB/POZ domain-containing protein 6-B-like isoform X2 [Macrosteles quadrilineatus]XP_054285032.1 BTB/POZ domain-containing protein 6-B-like isoform X2 [Macrosteles quadrilineatus]
MERPQLDWQIHKTSLISRFKELHLQSHWSDCAFRAGDEQTEILRAHKLVLAASSPVFEALFYGTLAEKSEIINVPDLEPQTFRLLLKYIYCDSTELDCIDTAGQLLYAAKKYMIPHLARVCLDYLLDHLFINNLWDILAIAEELHEEELLSSCLKVMCQYPGDMWVNPDENIGLVTLSRLLDQPSINLLEAELYQLIADWASAQCSIREISPSAANKRTVVNQAGLLSKVRFLTLSLTELSDVVEPSGLLSEEEIRSIKTCINNNSLDNISLPVGFNTTREMRKRFMSVSCRCLRHILTKRKRYMYSGTIKCKVSSDTKVMVTGFEVFTRIATTADYIMGRGSVSHYPEDLVVTVCDEEGNVINRTEWSGTTAFFNVTQEVRLSQPVWFMPRHVYIVTFELSAGQYPLSDLSNIAFTKTVCFRFSQCEPSFDDERACQDIDVSFISGVIFNR